MSEEAAGTEGDIILACGGVAGSCGGCSTKDFYILGSSTQQQQQHDLPWTRQSCSCAPLSPSTAPKCGKCRHRSHSAAAKQLPSATPPCSLAADSVDDGLRNALLPNRAFQSCHATAQRYHILGVEIQSFIRCVPVHFQPDAPKTLQHWGSGQGCREGAPVQLSRQAPYIHS